MRLIDADAFICWVDDYYDCTELGQIVIEWINDRPTIEPKRGRWEVVDYEEPRRYGCSRCKRLSWYTDNYCPNCGAKMEASDD